MTFEKSKLPRVLKFAPIWLLPLLSALAWLGTLMTLLIYWFKQGRPHYSSMSVHQQLAYISDVGAQKLKPLFITGCCLTTILLDLSFVNELWLRRTGRLARNLGRIEIYLGYLSIFFALAGTVGLVCLAIFDTLRYPRLHNGFLLLFMAGFVLSAIAICAEYQRLGIRYREHRILRASFWTKLTFILLEVLLAIIFGSCILKKKENAAAVLEWTVAFVFTFYILTFFLDLLPASGTSQAATNAPREMEVQQVGLA